MRTASNIHNQEFPGPVLYRAPRQPYPMAVAAQGMTITDADGREYLDLSGGAAVSVLGHSHPDVVAAITKQVQTLAYAHTAFFTNEPQEQLAQMLAERFEDPGARVYFASGGSEANETALKLAWQYWAGAGLPDKKIVISREQSYHGNTFGMLSISGNTGRRRASAAPLLDWPRIAPCYAYRGRNEGESEQAYGLRMAQQLEAAILDAGADQVAAFICEPVVGSSLGVVAATKGYLKRVRDICDQHNVLLIFDEIMCGSGRTGHYFAHQYDGVRPDIVTLAKGIGGGYQPLAAVIMNGRVGDVLSNAGFAHGHTYIGHPTACAAGVAVLKVIERDQLLMRTDALGEKLLPILRAELGDHENVGDIRGRGLFAGIELVADRASQSGFADATNLPDRLRLAAMAAGLIVYPGGIQIDGKTVPHIMMAPPMIATEEQLQDGAKRLRQVIETVLSE